jgi:hypothetical protein
MNDQLTKSEALQVNTEPSTETKNLSTEVKPFTPTPVMMIWLNTAIQTESESPTEIAEHCEPKVDRTNWYKWLDIPGFLDWYTAEWNRKLRAHAPRLDIIGLKNARKDFKYWESMQHRVGNLIDTPKSLQQFNVNGEMSVEFGE